MKRQQITITTIIRNRPSHRIVSQIFQHRVINPTITHISPIRMHCHTQIRTTCITITVSWRHHNQQRQIHHQAHHLLPSTPTHHPHKLPQHRCSLLATIIITCCIIHNIQTTGIIQQLQQDTIR